MTAKLEYCNWGPRLLRLAALTAVPAVLLAACGPDRRGAEVAGWSAIEATDRHPIIVTQQPARLTLRVPAGSSGLTLRQIGETQEFLARYRATDTGDSRLVITVPSGTANEIAAMQATAQVRALVREAGFGEGRVAIEPVADRAGSQPPIRLSYMRYTIEAPECGIHPTNLARDYQNLPPANFGCATQRALAAQIANPADLVHPRAMDPRVSERRDETWQKYVKGDSTTSKKDSAEKLKE
jgi:pilus assembly protein CpaD